MNLRNVFLALIVITSVCFVGCTKPVENSSGGSNTAAKPEDSKPKTSDADLKKLVEEKFKADLILSKETLSIEVKDGNVTVTGMVKNSEAKIKAEDVARGASEEVFSVNADSITISE